MSKLRGVVVTVLWCSAAAVLNYGSQLCPFGETLGEPRLHLPLIYSGDIAQWREESIHYRRAAGAPLRGRLWCSFCREEKILH